MTKKTITFLKVTKLRMTRFFLGIAKRNSVRYKVMRNEMNVEYLHNKLRESRLRWKDHVLSKEESYLSKMALKLHVGKRKRGRPRRRERTA